jgi:predicted XRE-type DNA-binding protein
VICATRFANAVFVLHAFQKETHRDCEGSVQGNDEGSMMPKVKVYASVWDPLADTPEQAVNLRARAELMQQIAAIVKKNRWTQTEAAQRCAITQPYMDTARFAKLILM